MSGNKLQETDIASLHIKDKDTGNEADVKAASLEEPPMGGKVKIWRIENFEKVLVSADTYGEFFDGDSYIVLYTYTKGTSSTEEYIIYFWQGNDSTKDETGSSAVLTTMLDDELGGTPVQIRVTQGKEPRHFRALFNGAMIVHFGGVASGFKNVDDEDEEDEDGVALYHVHGSDSSNTYGIFTKSVASSLTSRDCFCLVNGRKVYLWEGSGSNDAEKQAAMKIALRLKLRFKCRGDPTVVVEGREPARFWRALGGKGEYPKDRQAKFITEEPRLFHCSNMTGFWQVEEVDNFAQSDLNDDDVMLLDTGNTLFVWIGSGANEYERRKYKQTASEYIATSNVMSKSTPIIEIESGSELPIFTQFFPGWDEEFFEKQKFVDVQDTLAAEKAALKDGEEEIPLEPTTEFAKEVFSKKASSDDALKVKNATEAHYAKMYGSGKGTSKKPFEIDYHALHKRENEEEKLVDDGTGKCKIWRIENFERVEVSESMYGQFYDGDSYIVLYTYTVPPSTTENHILYFWQGINSTQDEKGASALETTWLDDELGGSPVQIRVTQGKEPMHFRLIFGGCMVIHKGGVASGFKNVDDTDEIDDDGISLYHIYGKSKNSTIGIYVEEKASSLTSRDCFVLLHGRSTTLWIGKGSNPDEVLSAANIASIISKGKMVKRIKEGSEPRSFWSALGGKEKYAKARSAKYELEEPRLFKCSDALGAFKITEITPFSQEDLDDTDVMMLDTGSNLFVWVGTQANEDERKCSVPSAEKYLKASPGRKRSTKEIVEVLSMNEPPTFKQFFPGWDPDLLTKVAFVDPLLKKEMDAAKEVEETPINLDDEVSDERKKELEKAASKEKELTDAEFAEIFGGMTKSQFDALPKWKQVQKKKEVGLF